MITLDELRLKDDHITAVLSTGESIMLPPECGKLYSLAKGKVIDPAEYRELKEESGRFTCRRKAFYYLSIRSRSAWEMEKYLVRKGFARDHIRDVILDLKASGYIDDMTFALRYISYRKDVKAVGPRLLRGELYKKGVSREIIQQALRETGAPEDDREAAYGLAKKKLRTLDRAENKAGKVILFLRRRGYDEPDIRAVMGRLKKEGLNLDDGGS